MILQYSTHRGSKYWHK